MSYLGSVGNCFNASLNTGEMEQILLCAELFISGCLSGSPCSVATHCKHHCQELRHGKTSLILQW